MTRSELYALCDNLQISLEKRGKKIIGEKHATLQFGDLPLFCTVKVVSSQEWAEQGVVVIVQLVGNLGLLLSVDGPLVEARVLDLPKLSKKLGDGFLEAAKGKTRADVMESVQQAVVARFQRKGALPWQQHQG